MTDKLNIFHILERIDRRDVEYYQKLTDAEKKQVVPYVLMQWMTGTSDKNQIILINEVVNKRIFSLYKHPELLVYLLMACSDGRKKHYSWKKHQSKQYKFPKALAVMKEATGYSTIRMSESLHVYSNEDILQYASELGHQSDFIKELKTELSKR